MEETIFYQILAFNIIDSDLQVNKVKELKLTAKIVDLYTKYKYCINGSYAWSAKRVHLKNN